MKLKRITSLLIALMMLFSTTAFAEENTSVKSAEEQMAEVEMYSNYMQKQIVQVYAHTIADNYYYGIDDEELLYSVICSMIDEGKWDLNKILQAMINVLGDKYSEFYTPEQYKALTEDVSGEFSGIGVTITDNDKGVIVLSVIEDSPAQKAGVKANDYIIGVNGKDTAGMNSAQVRELVVGATGSEVKVKVRRGNEILEITCVRDTISVSQLETEEIDKDTAYIKLLQFTSTSSKEMEDHVKELQSKSVKNVILDLRDNPGGDLQAAIDIANIFISAGKIAELRYKNEEDNTFIYSKNYHAPRFKMIVLVNENSASASEFLAMAIQSRGAGKIMGTKTLGKGSMQALNRAVNGAGFKFTIGEFYSYKGQRINTIGVIPDFYVENPVISVNHEEFAPIDLLRTEEGSKGGDMTLALEQRLEALGLMEAADEVFDEKTKDAVSRLQISLSYDVTGIPGVGEYMFLHDYDYSQLDKVVDLQMESAKKYFK